MATAVSYSLPAAANYYTPGPSSSSYKHHQHQQQRGYRVCDQCGAVETPGARFRICGGCMTTQYCSQECQKVHWPSHKAICQHTQSLISSSSSSASSASSSPAPENLAKYLRKFTSAHSDLIGWAGFQALQLKRVPANIRQKALLIELGYLPSSSSSSGGEPDAHRRFRVASTHLVPRTYVHDPLVLADIARREERSRRTGGVGTLLVIIQCAGISQVVPVEVDPPAKITWDERADWEEVLRRFVAEGRTDFKPISTTEFGIVYG